MLNDKNIRLIARLDIKGPKLIKGVHLEGLRVIGDPQEHAIRYYNQGADEIIYMDIVASLYQRSISTDIVKSAANDIFVPLTVGGGIRSVDDVKNLLKAGADKIAINTAAVHNRELISEISRSFGSQCMVLSIEAKQKDKDSWEVYTDCGRESTGIDAVEWAKEGVELGAGEILVTSIDKEGTRQGMDNKLVKKITDCVNVPVISSGGYGEEKHMIDVVRSGADAVAFADCLHFNRSTIPQLRDIAIKNNISVRTDFE